MEKLIQEVAALYELGELHDIEAIQSGLTNQVFTAKTQNQQKMVIKTIFAAKARRELNGYRFAEHIAQAYQNQGIACVAAMSSPQTKRRVHQLDEYYVSVYPFVLGEAPKSPVASVGLAKARMTGTLIAKLHSASQKAIHDSIKIEDAPSLNYGRDQQQLTQAMQGFLSAYPTYDELIMSFWTPILDLNQDIQAAYQTMQNQTLYYSHADIGPHNILWYEMHPTLIDWEWAGLIHPDMEFMIALIMSTGFADVFDQDAYRAMITAFYEGGCHLHNDVYTCLLTCLAKAWLDWICYNWHQSVNDNLNITQKQRSVENAVHAYQSLIEIIPSLPELADKTEIFIRDL